MAGCTSGAANPKAEGVARRVPGTLSRWASPANRPCMPLPHGEYPSGCQQPRGVLEAKNGTYSARHTCAGRTKGAVCAKAMRGGRRLGATHGIGRSSRRGRQRRVGRDGETARGRETSTQTGAARGIDRRESERSSEREREACCEGAARSTTTTTGAKEGERRRKASDRSPQREQPLLASRRAT